MKILKLIPKYLWQYKMVLIVNLLFLGIFSVVSYLYRLEIEAVLYTVFLYLLVSVFIVAINFWLFCKKHSQRTNLLEYPMTMPLSAPHTVIEEDYLAIIDELRKLNRTETERRQNERTEYLDYYNTWIHQIKTPIAVMRLTLQGKDTEENRMLFQQLFRIEQYAEMALGFLRLDTSDFKFETHDLDEIIKDAIHKYAPLFIAKKLKLKYDSHSVSVLTDKKWLTFVIEQLLSNAIKYTDEGSVTITVKDKVLQIADTGIGIHAEDLPLIFEKGYTGFNGRLDRKSTGIGLYLCKKTLSKLSHKLTAESEPGKGSVFSLDMNTQTIEIE